MSTIEITRENAVRAYSSADASGKKMLKALLGQSFSDNVMERIKTYEDACAELGFDPEEIKVSGGLDSDRKSIQAYSKLSVIAKALNEGWEPDWKNHSQYKYTVWMKDSGSGLAFYGYGVWRSDTGVGSRLCFKSAELAEYAGKQFESIFQDFAKL